MAATSSRMGMMKRRHSFCLRGARIISDMRDLWLTILSNKRYVHATIKLTHFHRRRNSRNVSQNRVRSGIVPGRPLGVRLWLADVAAGLRIHREGPGAADRRAPRAMRLFVCASWHPGKA